MLTNEAMKERWSDGTSYNNYITDELESFRKDVWSQTLKDALPQDRPLRILDVGTGPGFFSILLAKQGHELVAIDSSDSMLMYAKENAAKASVNVDFSNMSADALAFEDGSFDAIVMRNVTWTLPHPQKAYTEFKRVLKPSGTLVIYDANWHRHFFDEALMKKVRQRELEHFKTYGVKELVCNDDMAYYQSLPLSNIKRPEWDTACLENLGFDVAVRENLGETVYMDWEKQLYGESPLFEIVAKKIPMTEFTHDIHNYWQDRSETFGFDIDEKTFNYVSSHIQRILPDTSLKVLDVGTGPGTIAAIFALNGHQVTGIDFSSKMIEKAIENAQQSNVSIDFMVSEAGGLPFEDASFDVVVSRNVVWALEDPELVIGEWRRILKPGGTLMYFDGNHYYYLFNETAAAHRQQYIAMTGTAHKGKTDGVNFTQMETLALKLPLSSCNRPMEWDVDALSRLGFEAVNVVASHPQERLQEGIAEGYYSHFVVSATKSHE